MELWIRSQDRQDLIIVSRNFHIQETSINPHSHRWGILLDGGRYIGEYNSEERALEVLDEIQDRIHQTFICKLNNPIKQDDYKRLKSGLSYEYPDKEFMIQTLQYELEPINSNTIIYEMPEE